MEQRRLGKSELLLSEIGFGAWAIGGGDYDFGWGPQDDADSIRAIHHALNKGVNWIDTAPVYGLGRSEEVVGKALRGIRGEVIIATKCGLVWDQQRQLGSRLTAASVREEAENSLRRLQTDHIDLYQMHWPDPEEEIEEAWATMADLVQEGKVRYIGVSNFSTEQMELLAAMHPIASLQPPYSMLRRDIEKSQLPYCGGQGIGIIAYSPLQNGLLTGKFSLESIAALDDTDFRKSKNRNFQSPQVEINLAFVEALRPIADSLEMTLPQLALAWVLRRPEVTSAITGTRAPEQIEETFKASGRPLEKNTMDEIGALLEGRDTELASAVD